MSRLEALNKQAEQLQAKIKETTSVVVEVTFMVGGMLIVTEQTNEVSQVLGYLIDENLQRLERVAAWADYPACVAMTFEYPVWAA